MSKKTTFFIISLIFLFYKGYSLELVAEPSPPNIIVILADDLGYGDLGGFFGGKAHTPHLNRLAEEGMLFTDFHSNGAMCSPTRAALLTGRYQQRLGIEDPCPEIGSEKGWERLKVSQARTCMLHPPWLTT